MTDLELDQLLDTWQAPAPTPAFRRKLRAPTRRQRRPLRWALLLLAASLTLMVATGQRSDPVMGVVNRFWENALELFEVWSTTGMVNRIRQSDPKVYVDGQPAPPPRFVHAAIMEVDIPGEGVYFVTVHRRLQGWTEAGRVHGNLIEFRVGEKRVIVECNRSISADHPVAIRRQP